MANLRIWLDDVYCLEVSDYLKEGKVINQINIIETGIQCGRTEGIVTKITGDALEDLKQLIHDPEADFIVRD